MYGEAKEQESGYKSSITENDVAVKARTNVKSLSNSKKMRTDGKIKVKHYIIIRKL